ncbi:MAG: transaldolase family protein, partial [Planctomycetia bacterium]
FVPITSRSSCQLFTKDPKLSDTLYVTALAAPHTVNTIPEQTLLAFADHGGVGEGLSSGGGSGDETVAAIARSGVDLHAVGEKLQRDGADAFVKSWHELLDVIGTKSRTATAPATA